MSVAQSEDEGSWVRIHGHWAKISCADYAVLYPVSIILLSQHISELPQSTQLKHLLYMI